MKVNPFIFRGYDIRGVVDLDLSPVIMESLGKAYGTFLIRRDVHDVVCGRDCRLSSESFQKAFINGILTTGINVTDLGMVMTQMVYFAQHHLGIKGAAMITASHNPSNYNGLKLATGLSKTTEPEDLKEIQKIVELDTYDQNSPLGSLTKYDISHSYTNHILDGLETKLDYKIVLDSHHGTTGVFNPSIFRLTGCEVVELNSKPDGSFPLGTPDPTDEKLMKGLATQVLSSGADLGFAFDGDGDRMGVVDSKGRVLWSDVVAAIFAKQVLGFFPGAKVVFNTLCSQLTEKAVKSLGGVPIMWRTGHSFIKDKMRVERAKFGAELSGHFFFTEDGLGFDDGTMAAIKLMSFLKTSGLTLCDIYDDFPNYISSPEIKIGCPDDKKINVINRISMIFKSDFPSAKISDDLIIPNDDGVRADFDDGMMVFRYSQNGPYITVRFEANDTNTFELRRSYVKKMLNSFPEVIWKDDLGVNIDFLL